MARTMQVEVWVVVDEDENYDVGGSEEQAVERFVENVGEVGEAGATRRIKVLLTVPVPETVTLTGTVPAEGDAMLTVS